MNHAFDVLFEMQDYFEDWFPYDENDTQEDKKDYFDAFARALLNLSIAEYSRWEYGYLFRLLERDIQNDKYRRALEFIYAALDDEYGDGMYPVPEKTDDFVRTREKKNWDE